MNNEPPMMAQLTAISGKKIPKELYNAGEFFHHHLDQLRNGCDYAINKMKAR